MGIDGKVRIGYGDLTNNLAQFWQGIPCRKIIMTENNEEFEFDSDSLEIDDEGYVTGSACLFNFVEGYDVSASVSSYEYERNGETKMNHVPHIVVSENGGNIVSEPTAHDSSNPKKAIENAKNTAKYVAQHPNDFVN